MPSGSSGGARAGPGTDGLPAFPRSATFPAMSALAATYKFTTEDFYHLHETGLFHSKDRVELLNGEIIILPAIGSRLAQAVSNFTAYLGEQARRRFKVSPQNPVELERSSMPQPDLTLIPWSWRAARSHPTSEVVFLIIEVAD